MKLNNVIKALKERRFKVFPEGRSVVDVTKVRQCSSPLTGGVLFAFEGTVSESFDVRYIHESEARPGDPVAFVVALRAVNPIELSMVDQIVAAVPDNLSVRIIASQAKRRFDQMVKGLPDTVGDAEAEVAAQLIVNVRRAQLVGRGDVLTFAIERWEGSEKDAKDTNKRAAT